MVQTVLDRLGLQAARPARPTRTRTRGERARRVIAAPLALMLVLSTACSAFPALAPTPFQAASFVPADTWFFSTMSFRPSLGQAANLRGVLEAFTSQPGFGAAVKKLQSSSGTTKLDFEKDLLPLLDGEVAVAAFGLPSDAATQVVGLVHASDADRLMRLLLAAAAPDASPTPAVGAGAGTTVSAPPTTQPGPRGSTFYTDARGQTAGATFRGWLVFSESRFVLEQTIDRIASSGAGSLGAEARYQAVAARLPAEKFSYGYVDVGVILADSVVRSSLDSESEETRAALDAAAQRVGFALSAVPGGIEMRTLSLIETPRERAVLERGDPRAALERLPGTTLGAVAGDSFSEVIAETQRGLGSLSSSLGSDFADLRDAAPAELQAVVDSLAGREYAFGVDRRALPTDGSPRLSMAGLIRLDDSGAASASVEVLTASVDPESVTLVDLWGQTVPQVVLSPEVAATLGIVDDWINLLLGPAEDAAPIVETPPLPVNPRFGLVQRVLAREGTLLFFDLEAAREALESTLSDTARADYESTARPFVTPFRALAGSMQLAPDGAEATATYLLAIQK